jgi:hypothetical protein
MANPRLQVVLPKQVYDDLARIARYSDTTMSGLVARMVTEGADVLHQLADTLEQAHGLSVKLPGALQAKLATIEKGLEAAKDDAQEGLDLIQNEVGAHIENHGADASAGLPRGGRAGASAPPPAKGAPPYINKGVRK